LVADERPAEIKKYITGMNFSFSDQFPDDKERLQRVLKIYGTGGINPNNTTLG